MRTKNIKITVKETKTVLNEFAQAYMDLKNGKKITPHYELSFATMATLRKILTEKRIALLRVIKEKEPDSIYELAHLVHRDLKSVNTDITILASLGIITLETSKDERTKVKPIVAFDKLNVEIAI
ncbi:MAG: hypothetical protein AABY01_00390 [Nanoarchaeota archaeon]